MRAVLIGNYGAGNLGDEALREYFLRSFPHVEWQVLSAHPAPGQLHRLPGGLRSFLFTPWWRTLRALWRSDAVVFGGGTLLTDIESSYACFLWSYHVFVARLLRKPVLLAFQGIGPFRTRRGEWLARKAVAAAALVSVRDDRSRLRVESWKLNSKIVQSFDPIYKEIYNQKTDGTKNILILIPRENSSEFFQKSALLQVQKSAWDGVHILSLAPASHAEHAFCLSLVRQIPNAELLSIPSIAALVTALSHAAFVLTERYHGGIAALALNIPFTVLSQGEGDKLAEIAALADSHDGKSLLEKIEQGEDALRDALCYHAHSSLSKM